MKTVRPLACFVCDCFLPEATRFLSDSPLKDRVELHAFAGDCRSSPIPAGKIPDDALVLGGACVRGGRLEGAACFSLIAPDPLVENLVREGAFLVSPGWLADWKAHVAAWGFPPDGLKAFARETMKRICLLDTLVLPDSERRLDAFSAALDLPSLRIPVGLDHFTGRLEALLASRLDPAQEEADAKPGTRPPADYAMALDLLAQLNLFQTEAEGIQRLLEIFFHAVRAGPHVPAPI